MPYLQEGTDIQATHIPAWFLLTTHNKHKQYKTQNYLLLLINSLTSPWMTFHFRSTFLLYLNDSDREWQYDWEAVRAGLNIDDHVTSWPHLFQR